MITGVDGQIYFSPECCLPTSLLQVCFRYVSWGVSLGLGSVQLDALVDLLHALVETSLAFTGAQDSSWVPLSHIGPDVVPPRASFKRRLLATSGPCLNNPWSFRKDPEHLSIDKSRHLMSRFLDFLLESPVRIGYE